MKNFLKVAGFMGLAGGLFLLERIRPLRNERESKTRRNGRNLAVAGLGALTIHFAESPITYPLAKIVERRRWGLLQRLRLPRVLQGLAAVWTAVVYFVLFPHPHLKPSSPIFWFMMQIAMMVGFSTSYPVNKWLLRKGIKEVMG